MLGSNLEPVDHCATTFGNQDWSLSEERTYNRLHLAIKMSSSRTVACSIHVRFNYYWQVYIFKFLDSNFIFLCNLMICDWTYDCMQIIWYLVQSIDDQFCCHYSKYIIYPITSIHALIKKGFYWNNKTSIFMDCSYLHLSDYLQ